MPRALPAVALPGLAACGGVDPLGPAVAELAAAGDDTVSILLVKKAKGGWSPPY